MSQIENASTQAPQPLRENKLQKAWRILSPFPGGKWLVSKAIGRMAPYTGSIGAQIVELKQGYCRVEMRDRKKVRNHLQSIHAIALLNLAEVTSGVAMMYSIPPDARGILSGFSIDYIKKGRGTLVAECSCDPPSTNERMEYLVDATIRDQAGDIVATAQAKWLIGPRKNV